MEYSNVFVCLLGVGTVFFGLICIIVLATLMSRACRTKTSNAPVAAAAAAAPFGRMQLSVPPGNF